MHLLLRLFKTKTKNKREVAIKIKRGEISYVCLQRQRGTNEEPSDAHTQEKFVVHMSQMYT